jgi:L-amino acid N-acyltransferase YncA
LPDVRVAILADLAALTAIRNHYIVNTHITFDTEPCCAANCIPWFEEHCDGKRYRMFVACD